VPVANDFQANSHVANEPPMAAGFNLQNQWTILFGEYEKWGRIKMNN